ncbi:MAG: DNA mismatch repair protein MutS, partial [Deltaproteobacteria bacterium]
MSQQTPMMRQYLEIKSEYPDAILFFRLGDFYEMFMEDAVTASRILDITLTSRNKGAEEEVPLCGVPYHSCQPYINKLVAHGYKVAICEQVEDPRAAKGIVRREVVRVVSPGLVVDTDSLLPKENNYLAAVAPGDDDSWGLAYVDITTGEFRTTQVDDGASLRAELASIQPRELVLADEDWGEELQRQLKDVTGGCLVSPRPLWFFDPQRAREELCGFFSVESLDAFGCARLPGAIAAAGAVLQVLIETQKENLPHIETLSTYSSSEFMVLDEATRRNLELTATLYDGSRKGSLLGVLDRTMTAMGGRKLRKWVNQPLLDIERIRLRQQAIASLVADGLARNDLRVAL